MKPVWLFHLFIGETAIFNLNLVLPMWSSFSFSVGDGQILRGYEYSYICI